MGKREDTKKEIKSVCEQLIFEHQAIVNFTVGFGKREECDCQWCKMARKLLREMEGAWGE